MQLPDSRWAELGTRVHWVDLGGPDDGPLVVCVHGLGGAYVNWLAVAPLLTPTCRVVALDLPGFGHTRGGGRPTSVQANAVVLHRFLTETPEIVARTAVGGPAVLLGNSMGGLISALVTAEHPQDVAALALLDPALPPPLNAAPDPVTTAMFAAYLTPGLGGRVVTLRRRVRTPEQFAMDTLRLCCSDPAQVPADVLVAHVELARTRAYYPEMAAEFGAAARSTIWALARRRRYAALLRRIAVPVLLVHGDADRLVHVAAARAAARALPHWRYEELPGIGHVPQLEAPERTAEIFLDWWGSMVSEAGRPRPGAAASS